MKDDNYYRDLMTRIVAYHRDIGFNGFSKDCDPGDFIRWYMKYSAGRNWLLHSITASSTEELDIKLKLNGY